MLQPVARSGHADCLHVLQNLILDCFAFVSLSLYQDWDILEYKELACRHCRERDQAAQLLRQSRAKTAKGTRKKKSKAALSSSPQAIDVKSAGCGAGDKKESPTGSETGAQQAAPADPSFTALGRKLAASKIDDRVGSEEAAWMAEAAACAIPFSDLKVGACEFMKSDGSNLWGYGAGECRRPVIGIANVDMPNALALVLFTCCVGQAGCAPLGPRQPC